MTSVLNWVSFGFFPSRDFGTLPVSFQVSKNPVSDGIMPSIRGLSWSTFTILQHFKPCKTMLIPGIFHVKHWKA